MKRKKEKEEKKKMYFPEEVWRLILVHFRTRSDWRTCKRGEARLIEACEQETFVTHWLFMGELTFYERWVMYKNT